MNIDFFLFLYTQPSGGQYCMYIHNRYACFTSTQLQQSAQETASGRGAAQQQMQMTSSGDVVVRCLKGNLCPIKRKARTTFRLVLLPRIS